MLPPEDNGMASMAAVRGGDDPALGVPDREDAFDRLRRKIGPVREDHDSRLDLGPERSETAPQRRAGPTLPVGAGDDPRAIWLEAVRPLDDHDLVDGAATKALEYLGKQDALLRRAKPRGFARGEHDGGDAHDWTSVALRMTTVSVGLPDWSPSSPIRSTASIP
jgi:hypothetical protein